MQCEDITNGVQCELSADFNSNFCGYHAKRFIYNPRLVRKESKFSMSDKLTPHQRHTIETFHIPKPSVRVKPVKHPIKRLPYTQKIEFMMTDEEWRAKYGVDSFSKK